MSQDTANYTLSAAELPAIRTFITFQGTFNYNRITALTSSDVGDYFGWLGNLSSNYGSVQNTQWKGSYDQVFNTLTSTDDFPKMYLVWQYLSWVGSNQISPPPSDVESQDTWVSYWYAFRHSYWWETSWTGTDEHALWMPGLSIPGSPPTWQSHIQNIANQWGDTPDGNLIDVCTQMNGNQACYSFEQTVLNGWKSFSAIASQTTSIWQSQHNVVTSLLTPVSVTADTYFFLLHLLIALATGSSSDQQLAQKIVNAEASSHEYPNDTFINQLVYLSLLYLADPLGAYGWNNAQLQSALQDLENVILVTDPASTAIKTSLVQHGKVLNSDASYPMQDPYTSIGFNQRKTDTLFALDQARQSLHS